MSLDRAFLLDCVKAEKHAGFYEKEAWPAGVIIACMLDGSSPSEGVAGLANEGWG